MLIFLITVSGYGLGALAALLGTRGVSGRTLFGATVVGAAAGLTPGIVTLPHRGILGVSLRLLPKGVGRAYANPGP